MEMQKRKSYLEADPRRLVRALHCSHDFRLAHISSVRRYWTSAYLAYIARNKTACGSFSLGRLASDNKRLKIRSLQYRVEQKTGTISRCE